MPLPSGAILLAWGTAWGITPLGIMIGLLPSVVFLLAALLAATWRQAGPAPRREAMLLAAVGWGAWLVLGTELLSLARAISFLWVLGWWLAPLIALGLVLWLRRRRIGNLTLPRRPQVGAWPPMVLTAALLLLAGVVAVLSPPNTFDATRYHMPRQVHWMQQHSVAHISAADAHLTSLPPMAEFAGLHLMVLSGGDFYATLIQWCALVLGAVAASAIAAALGGRGLAQSMAALLVVSNPMAWLQASSAKNDVVAALWVLIVAYGVVLMLRDARCGPARCALIGSAAGLAALTKATAVIFAAPLLAVLGVWLLVRRRAAAIPAGIAMVAIILVINAGHFERNVRKFGSPHAPTAITLNGRPLSNEVHAPAAIGANMARNIVLHAGTPWPRLNDWTEKRLRAVHHWLDWDPDDKRTGAYRAFAVRYGQRAEETAAAPVHVVLVLMMFVLLPVMAWRSHATPAREEHGAQACHRIPTSAVVMVIAAVFAFVLFCTLLKWQPWHARLHVGLLALFAPLSATVLCRGRGAGAIVVCLVLMLPLAPTALWNHSRPLTGHRNIFSTPRQDLLERRPQYRDHLDQVTALVQELEPRTVGLRIAGHATYPVQRRLLTEVQPPPMLTHPFAPTDRMLRSWPSPDVVIVDGHQWDRMRETSHQQWVYRIDTLGMYNVLVRPETALTLYEQNPVAAGPLVQHPP